MAQSVTQGDLYVNGNLAAASFTAPTGSITDAMIQGNAGIDATKLDHQHQPVYAQPHGTAAITERQVIHVAKSAGEVVQIQAGVVVACVGAATITVDLRKNGTTVLTGAITIDNGDAAYAEVAGTVSVTTYVAGDVFEVVVTATAGGGTLGQGLYVAPVFREAA
jgi:hypothetical protein